ncbi:MAG: 3-keto-5-aminohexanoate cleavage protein [Chromatiales bacterium]|nr:3-keto-5-aminohexanoate cleavage protein [Chromatiales bacterium]
MQFLDDSLLPENQQHAGDPGRALRPRSSCRATPDDIPVSMDEQVQKAVDCYNAGATVLHVHVPRGRRQGQQAPVDVQRDCSAGLRDARARHAAAGRRLDLLRARRRRRATPSG